MLLGQTLKSIEQKKESVGMKRNKLVSLLIFLVILVIYSVSIFLAFLYYPKSFNPLTNTPPELGNVVANPSGALVYNIGVLVTSIPVVVIASLYMTIGRQNSTTLFKKGKAYFTRLSFSF